MKTRKIISSFCAICLLMTTALPFASAAESRAAYAGQTIQCQVVIGTAGSITNEVIPYEVSIPANATVSDQAALIQRGANAAAGVAALRGPYIGEDLISQQDDILNIVSGWDWIVGGGKITQAYKTLYIQFFNINIRNGASKISVTVDKNGRNFYAARDIDIGTTTATVYMVVGKPHGGGINFEMKKDDILDVYATTDRGGIELETCYVSASMYKPQGT